MFSRDDVAGRDVKWTTMTVSRCLQLPPRLTARAVGIWLMWAWSQGCEAEGWPITSTGETAQHAWRFWPEPGGFLAVWAPDKFQRESNGSNGVAVDETRYYHFGYYTQWSAACSCNVIENFPLDKRSCNIFLHDVVCILCALSSLLIICGNPLGVQNRL